MTEENPKLFISYSWTNSDHEQWVLDLATELRDNGIDVILDKWDLKEGHDSYEFMEKMVTDPKIEKVILVCDEEYAKKADNGEGGVGAETQIITPELYSNQEQDKFVAVVKEKDDRGKAYVPTFYKSRIHIDLSTEENFVDNFEQLIRWVYNKPLHKKPELGEKPSYLSDDIHIKLGTTSRHRRVVNAIKNGKDYWAGALSDLFDTIIENLERFRMDTEEGEIDEIVINNIEEFIPYRNDLIQLFLILGKYKGNNRDAFELTHDFFERILNYTQRKGNVNSYKECDFDNFKFIVHELFLYANTCLLKNQAFEFVNYLLQKRYYFDYTSTGKYDLYHYNHFRQYIKSFKFRSTRTNTKEGFIHGNLLKTQSEGSGITYRKLMETDFILYLRSCYDSSKSQERLFWYPVSLVFARRLFHTSFELFTRSKSKTFFKEFKIVLGISSKEELEKVIELINSDELLNPKFDYFPLDVSTLSNISNISTLE